VSLTAAGSSTLVDGTSLTPTDMGLAKVVVAASSTVVVLGASSTLVLGASSTLANEGSSTLVAASSTLSDAGPAMLAVDASPMFVDPGSPTLVDAGSATTLVDAGPAMFVDAGSAMLVDAGSAMLVDAGSATPLSVSPWITAVLLAANEPSALAPVLAAAASSAVGAGACEPATRSSTPTPLDGELTPYLLAGLVPSAPMKPGLSKPGPALSTPAEPRSLRGEGSLPPASARSTKTASAEPRAVLKLSRPLVPVRGALELSPSAGLKPTPLVAESEVVLSVEEDEAPSAAAAAASACGCGVGDATAPDAGGSTWSVGEPDCC
jgi:hypothetical protein